MAKRSLEERFWKKVIVRKTGCWGWSGAKNSGDGRAVISFKIPGQKSRTLAAYRVSWLLHFGPIPLGINVCHHCDNRECVRPDHLFLGTQAENMADAKRKGRTKGAIRPKHGEKHYKAILSASDVRRIFKSQMGNTELGRKYGVDRSTIYRIKAGKNWVRTLKRDMPRQEGRNA